jgi:hypothetical protein
MMPGTSSDAAEMAVMGLDTSVLAPAIILLSRSWRGWRVLAWPATLALPAFVIAHAAVTVWMTVTMPPWSADLAFQALLIAISFVFWLPVIGRSRRLSDGGQMVYLFLAMPAMDLAGVFVVLHGDATGGLAMIVAMLPVGGAAVLLTWRWMLAEAVAAEVVELERPTRLRAGPRGTRVSGKGLAAHGRTASSRAADRAQAHR